MSEIALTIAGFDRGGRAGVRSNLRAFALHCVHGGSAITCVTAQNTVEVTRIEPMSVLVRTQIE